MIAILSLSLCFLLATTFGLQALFKNKVDPVFDDSDRVQIQQKANAINENVKIAMALDFGFRNTESIAYDDTVLEDYVTIGDKISIDVPKEIKVLLDTEVKDYLDNLVTKVNNLLSALENINLEELNSVDFISIRGFSVDAGWLALGIDLALAVVNTALIAIKWLGKKAFVNLVKKYIPTAINVILSLNSAFAGIRNTITGMLNNASDAMLLRFLTIGGIVASIVDACDKDGWNGWITF